MHMCVGVKAPKVVTIQISYVCLIDVREGEVREEEKDKNLI
jgi:hypothetical protein